MKTWKIVAGVVALAAVGGSIYASMKWNQKGIVTVQTGKTVRQDLTSVVTASGEIKPRNYINIGSNAQGASRITDILVVEGAKVRKGQLLAKLESVQPEAEVSEGRPNDAGQDANQDKEEDSRDGCPDSMRENKITKRTAGAEQCHPEAWTERVEPEDVAEGLS